MSATFITRFSTSGTGVRVAVKDIIDIAGEITTAGCLAVSDDAIPAIADARCLVGTRAAGARLVGKANLHELAYGADGINPSYGTPTNPLDPSRCPGGSSSGSAVAVATDEADVAYGSDTGGSIRIPAACCGVVGLKTTWGRIPTEGVWPLAPSLDTIGPMATTVGGVIVGMDLLEPGFADAARRWPAANIVGRLRHPGDWPTNPAIDAAIDAALEACGFDVVEIRMDGWVAARDAGLRLLMGEAWQGNQHLLARPDRLTPGMAERIRDGVAVTDNEMAAALAHRDIVLAQLDDIFRGVEVIALPTLPDFAPPLTNPTSVALTSYTRPGNLAGTPAISLQVPVPAPFRNAGTAHLPASLQLIAPRHGEELLVATAARLEAAVG